MSRLISDILQAREPEFSHNLRQWERLAKKPAIDIHLESEIRRLTGDILDDLRLDRVDTNSRELYHGLIKKYREDSNRLSKKLSISSKDSPEEVAQKVAAFSNKLVGKYKVWMPKTSTSKRIIKNSPPKRMMKICGYRSVDAVLKRESPAVLIELGLICDPPYLKKLTPHYRKLSVSDFDITPVNVVVVKDKDINKIRQSGYMKGQFVVASGITGEVVVAPPKKRFSGDVLLLVASIIEATRTAVLYSNYFRVVGVQSRFGESIADAMENGLASVSRDKATTGWSSLHALAQKNQSSLPAGMEPHVQKEDMFTPRIDRIDELSFWHDREYIFVVSEGHIFSCNVLDVAINSMHEIPHEDSLRIYGQSYMWDELTARYLLHAPIREMVVNLE